MNSKRHTTLLEPPAEAAPYFDEEATVLAQPVVPLDADDGGRPPEHASEPLPETAPPFVADARTRADAGAIKRPPSALLLLSVLAGVVIGGAGFYLFQKQTRPEPAAASAGQAAAPAAEATPVSAEPPPADETAEVSPPEPDAGAPVEVERAEADVVTPPPAADAPRPSAEPKKNEEPDKRDEGDDAPAGAPKRGKRAEAEDDRPRRDEGEARPRRASSAETRRVETIVYPDQRREQRREERRAERRAERRERRSVDSVRGIFEGRP